MMHHDYFLSKHAQSRELLRVPTESVEGAMNPGTSRVLYTRYLVGGEQLMGNLGGGARIIA